MLLNVMTGEETFPNASAKVHVFWTPQHNRRGKETHIGNASKEPTTGVSIIQHPRAMSAAPGYLDELGKWTTATYDVPEGTLLKVFMQRSSGFGTMIVRANMFIQMRERAALRQVRARLTGDSRAQFQSAVIAGRFDVLSLDEAAALGAAVPPHFRRHFEQGMVDRACELQIMEEEISPRPQVETRQISDGSGNTRTIQVVRKSRALDLD